jgi:predicted nucleic acid-binding protein
MSPRRGLVLDANILMRAVLGRRVRELLERYEDSATFYSPDVCFDDARLHLARVLEKRGLDPEFGLGVLKQISQLVEPVDDSLYADYEALARERIEIRDPEDWPVVAVALMLNLLI